MDMTAFAEANGCHLEIMRRTGLVRQRGLTGMMIVSLQSIIDRNRILLVTSLDRLTERPLLELCKRLHHHLFVLTLNHTHSDAIKPALDSNYPKFKVRADPLSDSD